METRAVLAEWEGKRLTVWAGTQQPFMVRERVAQALRISEKRVRVVVPLTGGGFGGKHAGEVAVEAARLARASGRPVKLRWTREEEFTWGYFRPAAIIDVRAGAKRDGTMTAWAFRNINSGSAAIDTPYEVPNRRIAFQPAASPLAQGPYRALAATANTFARESHMDDLAHGLDIDPLDFRLAHLHDDRLAVVLNAAAEKAGWRWRRRGAGHGAGIACSSEKDARVATCVEVVAGADRRLEFRRSAPATTSTQVATLASFSLEHAMPAPWPAPRRRQRQPAFSAAALRTTARRSSCRCASRKSRGSISSPWARSSI